MRSPSSVTSGKGRIMSNTYQQEMAWVRSQMTEEDVAGRLAKLTVAERRKSMVRWEDGEMTPQQLVKWSQFGVTMHAVYVDQYSLYRLKTEEELLETALYNEYSHHKWALKDIPEDLGEMELAD